MARFGHAILAHSRWRYEYLHGFQFLSVEPPKDTKDRITKLADVPGTDASSGSMLLDMEHRLGENP